MPFLEDRLLRVRNCRVVWQSDNVGARRHHLGHGRVGQREYAADHLDRFFRDKAVLLTLREQHLDFFGPVHALELARRAQAHCLEQ